MKLSEAYKVPENVAGYLEWVSGILYINKSRQSWDEYCNVSSFADAPASQWKFVQTITHETYHFMQIAITGYLYQFACRLFHGFRSTISTPLDGPAVEQLLSNPPPLSGDIRHLVSDLDRPGPQDLTVRDIVESSAYLYDHMTHYSNIDPTWYDTVLEVPSLRSEYKKAYYIARDTLGPPHAMDGLLVASFVSLCFEKPPECFLDVLEIMASQGPAGTPQAYNLEQIVTLAQQMARAHNPLGTSAEVAERSSAHPIYTPAVVVLNDSSSARSPIMLLVNPRNMDLDGAASIVRPMLFKDGALWVPDNFREATPELAARSHLHGIAMLGAIARCAFNGGQDVSRYR